MSRPARSMRRDQRGFTLVEVLVAMLVSLVVIGAMTTTFVQNSDSSLAGQRQAQLYSVAQQQIEKVRGVVSRYGFAALALTGLPNAPTHAGPPPPSPATYPYDVTVNPYDPNDFIENYSSPTPSFLIETNYNQTTEGQISDVPSNGEPLEIDATNGQISPSPATVAAGSGTANVYTYVTQATVPCNTTALTACAADDVRRVIVAVRLVNSTNSKSIGPNTPVYMSTLVSNPVPSNQPQSATGLRLGLNIG